MAAIKTIKTRAGTRYQIQFYLCRERKYLSLDSGFTLKQARRFKGYIEDAVDAIESGGTPSRAVISFLEDLPRSLRQKFANAGLLEQSREVTTQELWQLFLDADSDRKMSTRQTYLTAQKRFFAFFKPDGDPSLITSADCKRWKKFLKSHGYADATLAGSHSRASAVFRWGVRHDYVDKNPFEDVKRESFVNEHRMHFVPMDHYERLLDACPDQTWRTLLALCRIGGLRNPSETLELRWTDVDWKNRSILVRSPKTEHHAGKESRLIPMFPRLREELEAQWDLASSGDSPFVIDRWRGTAASMRTHFRRIIFWAGLEPWDRAFQNLRESRANELWSEYPEHVASKWLGHSKRIAFNHYLQVQDAQFQKALGEDSPSPAPAPTPTSEAF